jgi:CspA family cold shock protein
MAAAAAVTASRGSAGGSGSGFRRHAPVSASKGVVKFFNPQKGFGFIVRMAAADVFVRLA